jgi:hypothetical protein
MSFAELETGLWFMCTWFTIETHCLAHFMGMTFLYLFLFGKFIKNDYTRSFLRNFC